MICDHLQAVSEGRIKRLLINAPPRSIKSTAAGVFWPAWEWTWAPTERFLYTSTRQKLAFRDSRMFLRLIESEWYQSRWGSQFSIRSKRLSSSVERFDNSEGGHRIAVPMMAATGEGGTRICCDEPHQISDRHYPNKIRASVEAWEDTFTNRLDNPESALVVIAHRVAMDDLSAELIRQGYVHLCLPAEFKKGFSKPTPYFREPRKRDGDTLDKRRLPKKFLDEQRRKQVFGAVFGQNPKATGSGEVKRHWFRYWQYPGDKRAPVPVPRLEGRDILIRPMDLPHINQQITSWDFAFKDLVSSSWVVGGVLGKLGPNVYLLDQTRGKLDFLASLEAFKKLQQKHPRARGHLIEDKANGPAIIATIRRTVSGVIPWNPKGSKPARARAVLPVFEAGNFFLPHPDIAGWVEDWLDEWCAFPDSASDDQIDMTSQGIDKMLGISGGRSLLF